MFSVSNHYPANISFALQYHDPACGGDTFRMEGWFNFVPGETSSLNIPYLADLRNANDPYFYYFIMASDGAVWAGQFANNCPQTGFNLCTINQNPSDPVRGFRELFIPGVADYTLTLIPNLQPAIEVTTERHQLGGWISAKIDCFSPLSSASWFADGLVGRTVPLSLGSINVDIHGHGESIFDARCWPNQFDAATIRVVDQFTGMSATGTSYAFSC